MTQLSEEQQKGVKEIERWLMLRTSAHSDPYADLSRALGYIRFLIPLLDSDSQAARALSHCALCEDPSFLYRDCVLAAVALMCDKCMALVKEAEQEALSTWSYKGGSVVLTCRDLAAKMESLTLDQVKPGEM